MVDSAEHTAAMRLLDSRAAILLHLAPSLAGLDGSLPGSTALHRLPHSVRLAVLLPALLGRLCALGCEALVLVLWRCKPRIRYLPQDLLFLKACHASAMPV
jgi:hypothetical protein